ncbi:hypothetical protein NPIL_309401 [Nephila pilipes]|uniref:Uncharacterized protein n=1 Tax=Nephila pilipes TaxID=299642 RepID=A0A8X6U572_NEPPI|nr:hypothetical protein NPIL_309401 [Nephila pilipes]
MPMENMSPDELFLSGILGYQPNSSCCFYTLSAQETNVIRCCKLKASKPVHSSCTLQVQLTGLLVQSLHHLQAERYALRPRESLQFNRTANSAQLAELRVAKARHKALPAKHCVDATQPLRATYFGVAIPLSGSYWRNSCSYSLKLSNCSNVLCLLRNLFDKINIFNIYALYRLKLSDIPL